MTAETYLNKDNIARSGMDGVEYHPLQPFLQSFQEDHPFTYGNLEPVLSEIIKEINKHTLRCLL